MGQITRNYWRQTVDHLQYAFDWAATGTAPSMALRGAGPVRTFIYGLIGFAVAGAWTLAGWLIAFIQGDHEHFLAEWGRMQAFFCLWLGAWLLLIGRSGALGERARAIAKDGSPVPRGITDRRVRVLIVASVAAVGSTTFIAMGFNASGSLLVFMWVMCLFICSMAGVVTLQAADLLFVIHNLQTAELKTFRYAPARTPELRDIVSYFSFFTLLLTIAYGFAFVGTLRGHWTGHPAVIGAVQWFWPVIYVPACSVALIYPHIVVHRLIKDAKDGALAFYQRDIDGLLGSYESLNNDDVQRVNTLAQVFDRISATPNYVFDLGIALRTAVPHAVNLAIFLTKPLIAQGVISP